MLIYTKEPILMEEFPLKTICKIKDKNDGSELYATVSDNLQCTAILEIKKKNFFMEWLVLKEFIDTNNLSIKYDIVATLNRKKFFWEGYILENVRIYRKI